VRKQTKWQVKAAILSVSDSGFTMC